MQRNIPLPFREVGAPAGGDVGLERIHPIEMAKKQKKQGAVGITTTAPYIAGQWGRGDNRLPE
jgi:hypothetical protein